MGSLVRDGDGVGMRCGCGGWVGGLTLDFRPTLPVVILRKICFIFGEERGGGGNSRGSFD